MEYIRKYVIIMMTKNKNIQSEILMTTMEDLVPKDSIFRKIDACIDFTFIWDEVKDLYCENNGKFGYDPIVLFKLVFIQALDGIKSMRKTCEKIKVDAEYRWFLGIPFGKDTPHYSTFSKNYERRFKDSGIFEKIFINIVFQAMKYNLLNDEFFTDSTHKKANANKNKYEDIIVEEVKKRKLNIEEEINEERKKLNKKEFRFEDRIEKKHIKVSITDPESGYYHRTNKEKGFMYLDHRTVNGKCNIIVDAHVTKGNVHDSVPYIDRINYIENTYNIKVGKAGVDSGYDNIEIKKFFEENNIFGVIAYRRYQQGNTEIRKYEFNYIEDEDVYVCPRTGVILPYRNIDKNGYKEYYDRKQCENCPYLKECCGKNKFRKIRRFIDEDVNERARERRLSEEGKNLFQKRKSTVERSFADSKQNHGFRYAMYKGLEKNQNYTWLICAAQNMKNISLKVENRKYETRNNTIKLATIAKNYIFEKFFQKIKERFNIKIPVQKMNWGLSTI